MSSPGPRRRRGGDSGKGASGVTRDDGDGAHTAPAGELRITVEGSSKSRARRFLQAAFIAWMTHYLLWAPALFVVAGWWVYRSGPLAFFIGVALGLLYLQSFLSGYQYKTGRPWPWFTSLGMWKLGHEYYDLTVVRTAALDAAKQYVFGFSPHGIMLASRLALYGGMWEKLFPGIDQRCLAARPMFYCPGTREIGLWTGGVDAGRATALRVLRDGMSVLVYPGGSREANLTHPDRPETTLILRKGFIRVAMQHGASLVPTYVFGEKWLYNVLTMPDWLRACILRLKLPALVFWGRFFTLLPRRRKLAVVFGEPLETSQYAAPAKDATDEEKQAYEDAVEEVYQRYIAAIRALFEKHRDEFGYPKDESLVITDH